MTAPASTVDTRRAFHSSGKIRARPRQSRGTHSEGRRVARSPRLSGATPKNLARLARTRIGGIALQRILRADLGVDKLEALPDTHRADVPLDTNAHAGRAPRQHASQDLPWPTQGWAPNSATLTEAYRQGTLSPREVVKRALVEGRRLAALNPGAGPILCRFCFLGNLTGLPAASAPVGIDGAGLPVGLQLMGDAWDEATVLAACAHLERVGVAVPRRPRATASILQAVALR